MKKLDFKKFGLILEITSFALFIVSFVIYIIKFLRSEGILEITNITMNNMIKFSLVCFVVLCVVFITTIILRIMVVKSSTDNTNELKLILDRTIVACLIFGVLLYLVFYYLCIYKTGYSVLDFLSYYPD